MSNVNDGGPAFPSLVEYDGQGYPSQDHRGMSLRDWFAGQAMMGLLTDPNIGTSIVDMSPAECDALLAESSYRVADAMLKAREVRNG